jgi:hypothetical protein
VKRLANGTLVQLVKNVFLFRSFIHLSILTLRYRQSMVFIPDRCSKVAKSIL